MSRKTGLRSKLCDHKRNASPRSETTYGTVAYSSLQLETSVELQMTSAYVSLRGQNGSLSLQLKRQLQVGFSPCQHRNVPVGVHVWSPILLVSQSNSWSALSRLDV